MSIYVVMNRHIINSNRKVEMSQRQPSVRVTRGKNGKPLYCDSVEFHGPSSLINGVGEAVMSCGATVALETKSPVTLITRGQPDVVLS